MPGQRHHRIDVRGNSPPWSRDQRLRAGVQISRARVVAQSRPQMQHLIERRRRQRLDVGKRAMKRS